MATRVAKLGGAMVATVLGCAEASSGDGSSSEGTTGASGESSGVGDGSTSAAATASSSEPGPESSTGVAASESSGPVAPACGDGHVDPDELCDDGNDSPFDGCLPDCTTIELLDPPVLEWTYYEIAGTRCLDGSTAGFGISYDPRSPNVMIYLEGGGACFNDACDFTAFSAPFAPPYDGIFDREDAANPVADWTMIYVPYCTGDIHAGSAEAELGGAMRHFHGYDNIAAYLRRWVPSFPQVETVLLTGSSAGGFGAALNAHQVAEAYGEDVQIVVIDDSGPPLSSDVIPPCLQQIFRTTWNLDATALADCPTCDPHDFATDLFDDVLVRHPDLRLGLFSSNADLVIRTYMGFGWGFGNYDDCTGLPTPVPMLTYNNDLVALRAVHEDDASTFYVDGLGHTVLRSAFGSTSTEGTTLAAWVGEVIAGAHVHVGP